MISAEMESLQTYRFFVSEIRIVVKVLQNVKHESCSKIIIKFNLLNHLFFKYLHLYLFKYGQVLK